MRDMRYDNLQKVLIDGESQLTNKLEGIFSDKSRLYFTSGSWCG